MGSLWLPATKSASVSSRRWTSARSRTRHCHPAHAVLPAPSGCSNHLLPLRKELLHPETCQVPAAIISPSTAWAASPGAAAPCISLRLFTTNSAASCALPGVTGSAGAHDDGSSYCTWPPKRCGDMWGRVGRAAGPGAVAAAGVGAGSCCRQQSERLVYAGRRGLGLCAETLWREP